MRTIALILVLGCEDGVDPLPVPSFPPVIDFGEVALGAMAFRQVELRNAGSAVVMPPVFRVEREPTGFSVRFLPERAQEERGTLLIESQAGPVSISLVGRGVFPLRVNPVELDFGVVDLGQEVRLEVGITNVTDDVVRLTSELQGARFGLSSPSEVNVDGGRFALLGITYSPTVTAEDGGTLFLRVCNSDDCIVRVPLSGAGGGVLRCDRSGIAFGVDVGEVGMGSAFCRNESSRPVSISSVTTGALPPGLSMTVSPPAPVTLAANEAIEMALRFEPRLSQVGQTFAGTIHGEADPSFDIQYVVNAEVPPVDCRIDAGLPVDFGVVPIPTIAARPLHLTNEGFDPCLLQDFAVEGPFRLIDPITDATIEPGATLDLMLEYSTFSEQSDVGALTFRASDRDIIEQRVPLNGTGVGRGLLVSPRVVQLGDLEIGCAATASVAIHGQVSAPVLVSVVGEAFELVGSSTVLIPGAVQVRFAPPAAGTFYGTLFVTEPSGTYPVTLIGESDDGVTRERITKSSDAVDILLMVDDSSSTYEEQVALGDNFEALTALTGDYQIGVVSTDADGCPLTPDRPPGWQGRCGYLADGNPQISSAAWRIITPDEQPSPPEAFGYVVTLGGNGSGIEQGLASVQSALSHPVVGGWNAGFLRRNADLALVYLSDEEDQSPELTNYYRDWLLALKGWDERHRVVGSAIVGDPPGGCNSPVLGSADSGARYVQLVDALGGTFESICQTDWTRMIGRIGELVGGLRPRLFLRAKPVVATIAVSANGIPTSFVYHPRTNSVLLPLGAPLGEAEIELEYRTLCE